MNNLIILTSFLVFFTACQKASEQALTQSFDSENPALGDGNNSGLEGEDPIVVDPDEPIEIEGDQVCYESKGFSSCHKIVHRDDITEPEDYVYRNPNSSLGNQYSRPVYFIDLNERGTNQKVSPNFNRVEYVSPVKGSYGILSPDFVRRVQNMRDALGRPLTVNSGYRGPAYNARIGGATWSRHMYGDALDFKVSGKTPSELRQYCQDQGASYIQVYSTHIHCDWRNVSLAEEFYPQEVISVLAKAQTAEMNLHSHNEFYDNFELISEFNFSKAKFKVDVTEAEDGEGEILIEWTVYKDNKLLLEKTAQELNLSLSQGNYVVQVTVGGYWTKQEVFTF